MSEYAFGLDEDTTVFRLRSAPVTSSAAYSGTATLQVRRHLCLYFMRKWRSSITVKTATGGRPSCAALFTDSITTLSSRATRRCITPVRYFSLSQVQSALNTSSSHSTTARISPRVPDWVSDAVVYNIFPDSFASSRRAIAGSGTEKHTSGALSRSRLGGTINGIRENLDYISTLGANCIYLNPIFAAGQYHKYDTIDYLHIDPCLGTDEDFRALVDKCHARGIRVILDGVFNHCGAQFFAFRDVLERQERSRYASWFYRLQFPVAYPEAGERPNYECFCYERLMPKLDTSNPEVCDYLCAVGEHWLREFDTDGWRLDVADEPNDGFWREFRRRCKSVKSDALLIAKFGAAQGIG